MQSLTDQLDRMAKVGDTHGKKALQEAGDYVKDVEVKVVKRVHVDKNPKYSEDIGWKELKRYPVKVGKLGGKFVNIGIRANISGKQKQKENADAKAGVYRPTHWDKIKGLWFNNYGFFHNKTGNYIAGTNWIETAYDESVDGAYKIIKKNIEEGLGL